MITLPHPTVTGEPVVDGTLTASVSGVDPMDAGLTYAWTRGSTVVATGSTYSPTAADAGTPLTVTATATKPHFDDATSSTPTGTVAAASFTTGPTATMSGTLKVGETLTAGTGDAAPAPSGFGYQWSADGSPIDGADQATYLLAPAQKHTAITVTVTALRSGYASSSSTSAPTGDVATNLAPSLGLSVADASIRRGSSTRLTWNSDEATGYLTASGGWYGAQARPAPPPSGRTRSAPRRTSCGPATPTAPRPRRSPCRSPARPRPSTSPPATACGCAARS